MAAFDDDALIVDCHRSGPISTNTRSRARNPPLPSRESSLHRQARAQNVDARVEDPEHAADHMLRDKRIDVGCCGRHRGLACPGSRLRCGAPSRGPLPRHRSDCPKSARLPVRTDHELEPSRTSNMTSEGLRVLDLDQNVADCRLRKRIMYSRVPGDRLLDRQRRRYTTRGGDDFRRVAERSRADTDGLAQ